MKKAFFLGIFAFLLSACVNSNPSSDQTLKNQKNSEAPRIEARVSNLKKKWDRVKDTTNINPEQREKMQTQLLLQQARTSDFNKERCDELAGNWQKNDNGDFRCFLPVMDGGKICGSSKDCEEFCIAPNQWVMSGECQQEVPLRKCEFVLTEPRQITKICP